MDQTIHLDWSVSATLPPTSTWRIDYDGPSGHQLSPITDIISSSRSYTLTGLTNYTRYTVTTQSMLDSKSLLSDTVQVMPINRLTHLPIVLKEP